MSQNVVESNMQHASVYHYHDTYVEPTYRFLVSAMLFKAGCSGKIFRRGNSLLLAADVTCETLCSLSQMQHAHERDLQCLVPKLYASWFSVMITDIIVAFGPGRFALSGQAFCVVVILFASRRWSDVLPSKARSHQASKTSTKQREPRLLVKVTNGEAAGFPWILVSIDQVDPFGVHI